LRTYDLADGSGRTALDNIERGVRQTLALLVTPQAPPPPRPTSPDPARVVQRRFAREAA